MAKDLSDKELNEQIGKNSGAARELLKDKDAMERFLERLERKLKLIPLVGNKLSSLPILVSLVRSYVSGEYQGIPFASIVAIVAALIYFVSPIDIVPDFIPGFGYVDDAAVVGLVLTVVEDDVKEYKQWQVANGKRLA